MGEIDDRRTDEVEGKWLSKRCNLKLLSNIGQFHVLCGWNEDCEDKRKLSHFHRNHTLESLLSHEMNNFCELCYSICSPTKSASNTPHSSDHVIMRLARENVRFLWRRDRWRLSIEPAWHRRIFQGYNSVCMPHSKDWILWDRHSRLQV